VRAAIKRILKGFKQPNVAAVCDRRKYGLRHPPPSIFDPRFLLPTTLHPRIRRLQRLSASPRLGGESLPKILDLSPLLIDRSAPMPKKPHQPKKALYRRPPPSPPLGEKAGMRGSSASAIPHSEIRTPNSNSPLAGLILAEDAPTEIPHSEIRIPNSPAPLNLVYSGAGVWLYHNNCLAVLDAIYAKYGDAGRFDCIFADPPYFLSNGGITCHAGKMVSVHKGDWDQSRGPEWNHEFNTEWLKRCQRVLKPNGTIWVTGTHHVIFSVGFAMQQLGYKILNDIAWEKPNPPPNLSCRYFTHSTETILWAAKNEKSKHLFNYQAMKAVTGKQMKTVWKMSAPGNNEKQFGKHPTQKPIALVERCILASTDVSALVLDPFAGGVRRWLQVLDLDDMP
jgi:site-specific DNA-methyltransferase (adenine-specific)